MAAADRAVFLNPSDPEAHYARAIALSFSGDATEAIREYQRAAALRPLDYFLWYRLGEALDQAGDESGALAAFQQAVRLAPFYAKPRWQVGNLLLRAGGREEAFTELRRAAQSDPKLYPVFIDLVWSIYDGDVTSVKRIVEPDTDEARMALGRFFEKRGKILEAAEMLSGANGRAGDDTQALMGRLLREKRFKEAYELWASSHGLSNGIKKGGLGIINNGGFEEGLSDEEWGFGWQVARRAQTIRFSPDTVDKRSGSQSLMINFEGDSAPASPVISQLLLVESGSRYELRFAARTQDLTTGGLPVIIVTDARDGRVLATTVLPEGTTEWHENFVELAVDKSTDAVFIRLQRLNCSNSPCPVFGRVWLDDFELRKI